MQQEHPCSFVHEYSARKTVTSGSLGVHLHCRDSLWRHIQASFEVVALPGQAQSSVDGKPTQGAKSVVLNHWACSARALLQLGSTQQFGQAGLHCSPNSQCLTVCWSVSLCVPHSWDYSKEKNFPLQKDFTPLLCFSFPMVLFGIPYQELPNSH